MNAPSSAVERAPSGVAARWRGRTGLLAAMAFGWGALLGFPAQLPGGGAGLRTSELAAVLAFMALLVAWRLGRPLHPAAGSLAVALALTLPWAGAELVAQSLHRDSGPAQMLLLRWCLALGTAYAVAALMAERRTRGPLCLGLAAGLALSLGSVVWDDMTFDPATLYLTPEALERITWINGEYRANGIFTHPNAAAGTVLLLVPLVAGLVEERLLPRAALLVALAAIVAVLLVTQTRGPTLFASILLALAIVRGSSKALLLVVAAGGVAALMLLVANGGGESQASLSLRLFDAQNVADGASDRGMTVLASVVLALENPLGLGSAYPQMLEAMTGFVSTHNAFLQLALMGGLPLAAFVTACLLRNAAGLFARRPGIEAWMAAYLVGAFLFEDQFFVPTFLVLALWLLWRPAP